MADYYQWTGSGDGVSWTDPSNWVDVTQNQNPSEQAPGAGANVAFTGVSASLTSGGSCYDLTVSDAYLSLTGTSVGAGGGVTIESGSLVNLSGGSTFLSGTSLSLDDSELTAKTGAALKISGGVSLDSASMMDLSGSSTSLSATSLNLSDSTVSATDSASLDLSQGVGLTDATMSLDNASMTDGGSFTFYDADVSVEYGAKVNTSQFIGVGGGGAMLAVDAASVSADASFVVGDDMRGGDSTLSISDGGSVYSYGFFRVDGNGSDGSGTATVDGSGSSIDTADVITVGGYGEGTLTLTNEASATASQGLEVGWSNVGSYTGGTGVLYIESYSTVTAQSAGIGDTASDANGTVIVTDGSSLDIADTLLVGGEGTGTLEVTDRGTLTVGGALDIGQTEGGTGTMRLNGTYLQIASGGTIIGAGGTGTLILTNQASMVADSDAGYGVTLGNQDTGNGTLDIGDSTFSAPGGISIGAYDGGTGTVNLYGNSQVTIAGYGLDIGTVAGGSGEVTVSDNGTKLTASSDSNPGITVGDGGSGQLYIESGSYVTASTDSGSYAVIVGAQTDSTATVVVTEATLNVGAGGLLVGGYGEGTLTIESGGTVSFDATGSILVGDDSGGSGTLNVTGGGSTLSAESTGGNGLNIGGGGDGTVDVESGATVTTSSDDPSGYWATTIGTGDGSTGSLTVDGDGSTFTAGAGGLDVGGEGAGTVLVEDGGSLNVSGTGAELAIGSFTGGDGTVTVTGADSAIDVTGALTVGAGDGATGALSIADGGSVTAEDGYAVTIGTDATGTVTVEGDDSSLTAASLDVGGDDGAGTLIIDDGAEVDISDVTVEDGSTIQMGGGTLDTDPISLSGNLGGFGTVNGDITDDGGISAAGGTLDLSGAISGSGALLIDSESTLKLDGPLDDAPGIQFTSPGDEEVLEITSAPDSPDNQIAPTISGFLTKADTIDLTFLGDDDNKATAVLNRATDVLTVTAEGGTYTLQLDPTGNYAGLTFSTFQDSGDGTEITVACFCSGTRIQCPAGEAPIEELHIGDLVKTLDGRVVPIRWIGRRTYARPYVAAHRWVRPVLIRAGALAVGLPRRDLWVSPEHAMYVEGMLIPARDLVNGTSIREDQSAQPVSYYHLEFDSHEILLAEGAPSESFADDASRILFDNAAEYYACHGTSMAQARFCAPRVEGGWELQRVRRRLEALTLAS